MDRMLTLAECAPVARCSYSKLYKLAKNGSLPFHKLGSRWLISESQLHEALGLTSSANPPDAENEEAARSPARDS